MSGETIKREIIINLLTTFMQGNDTIFCANLIQESPASYKNSVANPVAKNGVISFSLAGSGKADNSLLRANIRVMAKLAVLHKLCNSADWAVDTIKFYLHYSSDFSWETHVIDITDVWGGSLTNVSSPILPNFNSKDSNE